ncbi:urease accessory protein UreF [Wenxinia marina]|uniref:Urease accessory protein UreF n=1 Tax=Wenxinia marina DSM 24838 TaxID=1123501 RepID=A0A0D0Q4I2_9RHOB|nr:urease accessory UreF family protein [Wenxinia marina]KIQ67472.1 Urease accessory protein UreF [Wenxinia marina DSM 24838]GGL69244.1 urease accessory protein UreF [Wenxinia marina]
MDAAALLTLTQWFTSSYPTGGFAWSHGLEAAVADGAVSDGASLRHWLALVIEEGAGRTDTILIGAAHRAEADELTTLSDLAAALSPSASRRAETLRQGAAFAATTRAAWEMDLPDLAFPVAVGRAARLAGLPAEPVALAYLQAMAANLVQAALRLFPLGQTEGQRVLRALTPLILDRTAAAVRLPVNEIGGASFLPDIGALRQEAMAVRLFQS